MERFIKAVKQFPCLWNTNDGDYRHGDVKENAWNRIVGLNLPEITDGKSAKSEWKKLRDNHRDSLKRHQGPGVNTWKYAKNMDFLLPYMKSRKGGTYLTNSLSTENTNTQQSTQDSDNEQDDQYSTEFIFANDDESNTSATFGDALKEELGSTQQAPTQVTRKRKNDDEIILEIENNHNRPQEERDIRRQGKHPIETFFESMAQTTKTMPTYLQNRIKKKVLHIVCEAEEEHESYSITSKYD